MLGLNFMNLPLILVSLILIAGTTSYSFSDDGVSISFDKELFNVDEKITVTVNDPDRKHSLKILVSSKNNSYEIDAYEIPNKPGTFLASFYLSSMITEQTEKISASYTYFLGKEKLTKTSEAKIITLTNDSDPTKKVQNNYDLSLGVVNASGSKIILSDTGDKLHINVTGKDNVVLRVVNLLYGIELVKWSDETLYTSYTPQKPGIYRFIATEFNATHSNSIFEDVWILEKIKEEKKPVPHDPQVYYNNEDLQSALSVQPSIITNHYNLSEVKSLLTTKIIKNEPESKEELSIFEKLKQEFSLRNFNNTSQEPLETKNDTIQITPKPEITKITIPPLAAIPGCHETNSCYLPSFELADVGDTVMWINMDATSHTVTSGNSTGGSSGEFDSGALFSGRAFVFTFDESGQFEYYCTIHPWMQGQIFVSKESPDVVSEYGFLKQQDNLTVKDTDKENAFPIVIEQLLMQKQSIVAKENNSCEDKVWVHKNYQKIACVNLPAAQKLLERGWIILPN